MKKLFITVLCFLSIYTGANAQEKTPSYKDTIPDIVRGNPFNIPIEARMDAYGKYALIATIPGQAKFKKNASAWNRVKKPDGFTQKEWQNDDIKYNYLLSINFENALVRYSAKQTEEKSKVFGPLVARYLNELSRQIKEQQKKLAGTKST